MIKKYKYQYIKIVIGSMVESKALLVFRRTPMGIIFAFILDEWGKPMVGT
jgi:hypothetical protein